MHVLMISAYPRQDSLSAVLRNAACSALESAGHTVELCDLYAEGFRPYLTAKEWTSFRDDSGMLPGVEDHVESLRRAEALLLVYPTWWYGMPAKLKGWFERGRHRTAAAEYPADRGGHHLWLPPLPALAYRPHRPLCHRHPGARHRRQGEARTTTRQRATMDPVARAAGSCVIDRHLP